MLRLEKTSVQGEGGVRRSSATRLAPWLAFILALVGGLAGTRAPGRVRGLDLDAFAHLPVLDGGRVKPIDSVARNSLLLVRSQQSFRHEGRRIEATEWLLDVLFRPAVADAQPVFVVDDPDVLGLLGLAQTMRYLPMNALAPHLQEIERQGRTAGRIDASRRTRFQRAIASLYDRVRLYLRLRNTIQLGGTSLAIEVESARSPAAASRHARLAELAAFGPLPPAPGHSTDAWRSTGEALRAAAAGDLDAALGGWARLSAAYRAQAPPTFDRAVAELREAAADRSAEATRHARREILFNRAQPFYAGMVLYVLALLALFASWLWRPELLRPTSFGLLAAAALVHTAGLAFRIVLQGRPPVTNLYSSAVFVGWVAVVLGLALERLHRRGFASAVAAAAGFASLVVAHHLATAGDTMELMRAVLDSNFWLATHVVAITIGYGATFLAGSLAIGHTIRKHAARTPDPASTRALVSMTYGVVCFALLFSFLGTVLGGIWADQSWGRFWGWDPKENGALLIVLWNAVILHARWGGYAGERGIMAMAIFGNVVTSLSWFGVNMLGIGLHSYGFMDKAFWVLFGFVLSQLALVVLALVPPRLALVRATADRAEAAVPVAPSGARAGRLASAGPPRGRSRHPGSLSTR